MTLKTDFIPYHELNRYYVEIVSSMHVSLQPLATDMRILRHEAVERHTENVAQELYQPQYSHVPWMVSEYFDLDGELLLKMGKAWWLTIIDVVVTDQVVDRQIPDIPAVSLMLQHLRLHAERLYLEAFGSAEFFWKRYHSTIAGVWNALALETYCVDDHRQIYDFETMKQVCNRRSDLIGTIISAIGQSSGQTYAVEPLCKYYENLTFADQLLDDANDWKSDFASGRYTLPIVMAVEAEKIELDQISHLTLDECQWLIERHSILVRLAEHAAALLQEAQDVLSAISPAESHLHDVLQQRLAVSKRTIHRYTTTRLMTGFLRKLQGAS